MLLDRFPVITYWDILHILDAFVSQVRQLADHLHDAILAYIRLHPVLGVIVGAYKIKRKRNLQHALPHCLERRMVVAGIQCLHILGMVVQSCSSSS